MLPRPPAERGQTNPHFHVSVIRLERRGGPAREARAAPIAGRIRRKKAAAFKAAAGVKNTRLGSSLSKPGESAFALGRRLGSLLGNGLLRLLPLADPLPLTSSTTAILAAS